MQSLLLIKSEKFQLPKEKFKILYFRKNIRLAKTSADYSFFIRL